MRERPAGDWRITIASWIVVAVAAIISLAPVIPPAVESNPAVTDFSTARALELVDRLAREPHPMGSAAIEAVRASIVEELRSLGLEPETQTIEAPDYFGSPGRSVQVVNVLARIPGLSSTRAVAVMGHYDTVPSTRGANDDTTAVSIMLETARALLAGSPVQERRDAGLHRR